MARKIGINEDDYAAHFKQWMSAHRVSGLEAAEEAGIPYHKLMKAFKDNDELSVADMWKLMDWARLPKSKAYYYFGEGKEEEE